MGLTTPPNTSVTPTSQLRRSPCTTECKSLLDSALCSPLIREHRRCSEEGFEPVDLLPEQLRRDPQQRTPKSCQRPRAWAHFSLAGPRKKRRHRERKRPARGPGRERGARVPRVLSRPPPCGLRETLRAPGQGDPSCSAHPGPGRHLSAAARTARPGRGAEPRRRAGPLPVPAWNAGLGGHLGPQRDPPVSWRGRPQQCCSVGAREHFRHTAQALR